jgi:hypothetical protein
MADAGPREVISEDRNLLVCHHIEYTQPRRNPLLRIGIAGKLSARILHLQRGLVTEVGDIDDRATLRADHKAAVADCMPSRASLGRKPIRDGLLVEAMRETMQVSCLGVRQLA